MPLIKSISGIRGTIGDRKGEDLTKEDIILYTKSFVLWLQSENRIINNKIVIGRDARISDLNLKNIKYFKENIENLLEVSIGHALITESLYFGLENTIKKYLEFLS